MSQNTDVFHCRKVENIMEVGRRVVLCYIFRCGTPHKSTNTPLDQYLRNLPPDSTANYPRVPRNVRLFSKWQKDQIKQDPSCTTFDTSLLFKAIKLACENVADYNDSVWNTPSTKMEYYVTAIKDARNDFVHGPQIITTQELQATDDRLRKLFIDGLTATKIRYNRLDAEIASKIKEVNDNIDEIMKEVFVTYLDIDNLKPHFIQQANRALKQHFDNCRSIDPVSFLTGVTPHLLVENVFTEVTLARGRHRGAEENLRYENLVTAARSGPGAVRNRMLLLEGEAGSGKTTLVTLLIDQWLKDAKDRTVTGLDYYDLMLRVQCRERRITSLASLLKNEVPSVFRKYHDNTLLIFRQCSVLFLIDGLDEINEDSRKLLDNILAEMKNVKVCTFLCTSRSESVKSFVSTVPQEYEVSYVQIKGIPEECRSQFIRRYHIEMKPHINDAQDTDEIVERVHELLKREHFRLPFNMVILTWIYLHDPSKITSTTTQTQLYYNTYLLCIEKLLDRLGRHDATSKYCRRDLETRLRGPMETVQYESLLALSHSQLTFENEAEDRMRDSCICQDIPSNELLSAFLTLKVSPPTYLGIIEQYSAPHKRLQDFYSALYVANHQSLMTSSGSVRDVLQDALGTLDKKLLRRLQNVLYHILGLLHLIHNTVLERITEEVVDMLHESGMRCRERWLDLIEDTKVNADVVRRVVPYFVTGSSYACDDDDDDDDDDDEKKGTGKRKKREGIRMEEENIKKKKDEEKKKSNTTERDVSGTGDSHYSFPKKFKDVRIRGSRVETFISLLPHLPPCRVRIVLNKYPAPRIEDLLKVMSYHTCVHFEVQQHFRDPDPTTTTTDQLLQKILPRSRLELFEGHLSEKSIPLLPPSLKHICLGLTDDNHASSILSALHSVYPQLSHLEYLTIHVPIDKVTPSSLTPLLPAAEEGRKVDVELFLSGVKDQLMDEACQMVKTLQCSSGYFRIVFPRASASHAGWMKLLEGLADGGVRINSRVVVIGDCENKDMDDQLEALAKAKLGCPFVRMLDRRKWP